MCGILCSWNQFQSCLFLMTDCNQARSVFPITAFFTYIHIYIQVRRENIAKSERQFNYVVRVSQLGSLVLSMNRGLERKSECDCKQTRHLLIVSRIYIYIYTALTLEPLERKCYIELTMRRLFVRDPCVRNAYRDVQIL